MRLPLLVSLCVFAASCGEPEADKIPSFNKSVITDKRQELGIQLALQRAARSQGFKFYQEHYSQDFGCSNVYSMTNEGGQIVVINPFGHEYKVLVYTSKKDAAPRLISVAEGLAAKISAVGRSDVQLCTT